MATVVFPPNPTIGQEVTDPATGTVWMWDGYKWTFAPGSGGGGGSGPPYQGPIIGVTDGSNAAPGMVGEYLSNEVVPANAVAMGAGPTNAVSLALTPGDWDCQGFARVTLGGTNVISACQLWISTVSATNPGALVAYPRWPMGDVGNTGQSAFGLVNNVTLDSGTWRINTAVPVTAYLTFQITNSNSGSTFSICGRIWARRMR